MTSFDAHVVDRIVREVMRRLVSDAAPTGVSSPSPDSAAAPSAPPPGTLVLHERVVAMAQLEGKLDGIQRLIVRGDAIVTPSVRDLLKEKQVRLEPAAGEFQRRVVRGLLAVADNVSRAQRLAEALPWDGLQWQAGHDIDQLMRQLQQATPGTPLLALAVTSEWARWVCQANRHPTIRAVAVLDSATLQQACEQLDVNLLVLDPSRLAEAELVNLSRLYLQHCIPAVAET